MDAFYAAVEQLDRPELRGKALLVGGTVPRAVVSTASYEARPFGVASAMPMAVARRCCPHAVVLPPRFERNHAVSRMVMQTLDTFSPLVEPLSLDEAFVDMTGCEALSGGPREMGEAMRVAVFEATRLTVSVGVSTTKYVAKVASDCRKPDGLTVVGPDEVTGFLQPLPIDRLGGVGPRTRSRLKARGLDTIGDVAATPLDDLERWFGTLGAHIRRCGLGDAPRARSRCAGLSQPCAGCSASTATVSRAIMSSSSVGMTKSRTRDPFAPTSPSSPAGRASFFVASSSIPSQSSP